MPDPIRVALAGAGGIGNMHALALNNLPDQFRLVAVYDFNPATAQTTAQIHGIPRICTSFEELIGLEDIDLVDLCSPSHLHFAQTLQAVEAGKDVVVEKPAAASLREIDALITARDTSGRQIMPIFQYRFWPGLLKLRHLRARGLTGAAYLTTVETHWRRTPDYYSTWHGKWASEFGGPLVTLAVHAHDVLTWVLGPVRSVFARAQTLVNPIETEDTVSATLEMADGSLASLSTTTGSAVQSTRHRFCFSRLSAESNTKPYNNTDDPWIFHGDTPEIQAEIDAALRDFDPGYSGFEGQFDRYWMALRTGGALPVTLEEARTSIELLTALYASIISGQPQQLPIASDHPLYGGWLEAAARHFSVAAQ